MKKSSILSSNKKPSSFDHQSFSTLSQTVHSEQTKKSIQTDQITGYSPENSKNQKKYVFNLPASTQISQITTLLTNKFSDSILHVSEDYHGGKILMKGIKKSGFNKWMSNIVDCLTICFRPFGSKNGSISDSFNFITIMIKKQMLNHRCSITIVNPYERQMQGQFLQSIIYVIQQQLKKINQKQYEQEQQMIFFSRNLSQQSIVSQQIQIKSKIFDIYLFGNQKKWSRFRTLFLKCDQNIKQEIQKYKAQPLKMVNQSVHKKQALKNPSNLIKSLVNQSDSLFRALYNYYIKENDEYQDHQYFLGLFQTQIQRQITFYAIEQALCTTNIDSIVSEYYESMEEQCKVFNQKVKTLNDQWSNKKCFNYLQLREKFTLPTIQNPYFPSIQILKTLPFATSLRQLLLIIQKVFSSVKTDCLKATEGKLQLSTMDDVLPVMIFVTIRAGVQNFPIYVKIIDDYVRFKGCFQLQQRIITTLYVAVEDVTKKWTT